MRLRRRESKVKKIGESKDFSFKPGFGERNPHAEYSVWGTQRVGKLRELEGGEKKEWISRTPPLTRVLTAARGGC